MFSDDWGHPGRDRTGVNMKDKIDRIKKLLRSQRTEPEVISSGLSTGSTLLNLACSGSPYWGFAPGHFHFIVGDSASGKTFLSLTCLAEAARNKDFDGYQFIFDNVENGAMMDFETYFGKKVVERLCPPSATGPSRTVEEFYFNIDTVANNGPFIYILDSMDALTTDDESAKFDEQKTAFRKGKQTSGSYGTSKAKVNSSGIRLALNRLKETKSILIVIAQTRDNIGFGFEKKTRSGGHALRFYASLELWSSVKGKIRKTVKGKERQTGITAQIQVKKNRLTGKERTIEIPIYSALGIDDVGSCVHYLIEEKHWSKSGACLTAPEFDYKGPIEGLIARVEGKHLERRLRRITTKTWSDIEQDCRPDRRRRYE